MVVAPTMDGMEGLGLSIQDLADYLYADDGLVVLTHPERLYKAFVVLYGIFNRNGLWTNTRKTVSMALHPCHAPVHMS